MKINKITTMLIAVSAMLLLLPVNSVFAKKSKFKVPKVTEAPKIDGEADKAWNKGRRVKVDLEGEVMMDAKMIHDGKNLYILLQWPDKDESMNRALENAGGWKRQKGNQDAVNIFWDINVDKFDKKGCRQVCHEAMGGKAAAMNTNSPKEVADLWVWGSNTTNPLGYMDDLHMGEKPQNVDGVNTPFVPDKATSGGNKPNLEGGKPKFSPASGSGNVMLKSNTKPFSGGNTAPADILEKPAGSRGDITAKGVWKDGKWTLEISRPLKTADAANDVQFADKKKKYIMGISLHNNTDKDSHFKSDIIEVTLD
ncbi:MAG: ethylbenzene dehydrogenase-related protein [Deltaproteobacteria bacterium]|nr:ethylbenzene dehydrogenase-related protein [Deltaproteobacteria bacterium]